VAAVLGSELTELLLALSPFADQLPEIGSVPQAPFGTVPLTVTVIDAVAPLASEKPLQLTTWLGFGLVVTVPVDGFLTVETTDSHPAVPPWTFIE
jgi:hypothetical protein